MNFDKVALHVPSILVPNPQIDYTKWSVIACDQYTSQPEYWREVERIVGSSPSTLRLILPEAYLGDTADETALEAIKKTMDIYLADGTLQPIGEGFVLVERTTSGGSLRRGLMVALDLESYDFSQGSSSLVRATEETVLERLPARVKIRSRASVELPHTMVLIDDDAMSVIEPLFGRPLEKIYDFSLMMNGGRVRGYRVTDDRTITSVARSLEALLETSRRRAGAGGAILYAVGDGNHSLAAAKLFWEEIKNLPGASGHPARYALVELVNLHDRGLVFEPIHRVLFNVDPGRVLEALADFFTGMRCTCTVTGEPPAPTRPQGGTQLIRYVSGKGRGTIRLERSPWVLEVAGLQAFIDAYVKENPAVRVDYIHGEPALETLSAQEDTMGFMLPVISKDLLFATIAKDGRLPRKAFSMGHADDKRFYLECRKIVP
ncbi:MAG TPA: DUF1015 domain-containing protein [Deltaproteobacteria bacterium]|nr:DUF1015 domain-containing protein [Deltaproteobacteria bacterium]HPP80807.1 DUF1015 domain-containing protein [Deltaproteobacteria bacterium]